jgi:hypothetical protein
MSKRTDRIKMARPYEPEVVETTIVGGQPPREGRSLGDVPRGVEVLIKKAAVDPAFKKILFKERAGAAAAIGLKLSPAEEAMLAAVPEAQLRAIIRNTKVSPNLRPAFLGATAGAMLAALSAAAYAEEPEFRLNPTTGIDAELPPKAESVDNDDINAAIEFGAVSGTVTDESGVPVNGALVTIKTLGLFITSDNDGIYYLANVPPGKYKIICSRVGYGLNERKILVEAGAVTQLSFILKSEAAGGIRPDRPQRKRHGPPHK